VSAIVKMYTVFSPTLNTMRLHNSLAHRRERVPSSSLPWSVSGMS